ncbi:pre-mRNA-splicing factor prp5 [Verruconis gallopava]|uniref:Pre-mRNA-splicing factor PRP46 n=1 Tax=Verruconis gallopava TaxID=253628 RepID=A0A0D2AK62_9PEZI|nr:pre-mRNA-splicing factor prp5 [Verruconis gallopava]KIW06950.1 pre-mRNA-splicing factor prp5 [Verruconis gallopava]
MAEVENSHVQAVLRRSAKRTRELFAEDFASPSTLDSVPSIPYSIAPSVAPPQQVAEQANIASRIRNEYRDAKELPPALAAKFAGAAASAAARRAKKAKAAAPERASDEKMASMIEGISEREEAARRSEASSALIVRGKGPVPPNANGPTNQRDLPSTSLVRKEAYRQPKPEWHAPWKLMRVISGHLGWVRALAVEPDNQWFASGAGDRTIKIWDLASGNLKLTLTGHISTVRGLAVSPRHPYLFSCGEDKMVKCWDLETNKVIRHYHGHLSGVYTLALHPTLDVLVTGGRDAVARVWDMRTRQNVHVLSGHKGTVSDVKCQEADPQVISASLDATVRLWDLAAGKTMGVLTHHKKGVRALATHPTEFTFASGSTNSIKQWKLPEGAFMHNFDGHNAIINTLAVNEDNVLVSGGDNGSMCFWDWKTGHKFQELDSIAQPGSLDAEAGLMSSTFDRTGLRLICGEADKTIKVWKPDDEATEETHPLNWRPSMARQKY